MTPGRSTRTGSCLSRPRWCDDWPGTLAIQDREDLGSEWDEAFAAMIEAADTRGWIADDGSIRAHIEWAKS